MKHIKTYQIFESGPFVKIDTEIKDYMKDIFQELEDEGFDIDIEVRWLRTYDHKNLRFRDTEEHTGYEVKIKRSKTFLLEDIYDYILTCKSYLKDVGFFITEIDGIIPGNNRQERYYLDYGGLHESDPEKFKLFDKPLIRLEFKIRKEE